MERKYKVFSTVGMVFLLLLLAVIPALAGSDVSVKKLQFRAHLVGAQEVPAVDTSASGTALFRFNRDLTTLDYKLAVFGLEDILASHIHCAPPGQNGPVGVTLFTGGPVTIDGLLAKARVNAPDPGNSCAWTSLKDVAEAIQSGNAYVNVHTLAHPSGEIRGQIH